MFRSIAAGRICAAALAGCLCCSLALPQTAPPASASPSAAPLRVFDASLIDKSVDPCENFYQYSCNGWFKAHPLPPDQASFGRFTELAEINRRHLREILEAAAVASPGRTPNEQKIGDEYASCMDTATIDKLGLAPLEPELDRIAALRSKDELPALVGHLHAIGVGAFFGMRAEQDMHNAAAMIENYSAGGLGLPERGFYTRMDAKSVEIRTQYVEHVAKMFVLAGEAEAPAKKDAETVLAIETRLADASLERRDMREPKNLDHATDVVSMSETLPHFSLTAYAKADHAPAAGKANDEQPKFFAEFDAMVGDTPIEEMRTYLRWHLLRAYATTSMPEAFETESWNFYSHILNGAEKQQERWKRCTSRVDREMGEALGQVWAKKYFPPEAKQKALEMTQAIERAMDKDIDGLDWMSPETKVKAKEKLRTVMNKIAYPDKWRDYSKLTIVRGEALGNQERAREFEHARNLSKIGKPVDKGEWYMSPPTVNAYYEPQQNNVNFPAGYFQPPFFSAAEDDAANYGDMGSTIGHELTHGFDDEGRQYDKDGNFKEWWTKDDEAKFNQRAQCMVNQYNAIEAVPGVHLDGKLTLGENLADLGGLWLAWLAWLEKAHDAHVDLSAKMDGYTPDQRFWIAYAQQWCTQTRPEQLRTQAQTNEHSPDEYRANTVLSDLPEFARSFSCKKTDKMVAPEPCRVW